MSFSYDRSKGRFANLLEFLSESWGEMMILATIIGLGTILGIMMSSVSSKRTQSTFNDCMQIVLRKEGLGLADVELTCGSLRTEEIRNAK